jgi:hypothetical protein
MIVVVLAKRSFYHTAHTSDSAEAEPPEDDLVHTVMPAGILQSAKLPPS